MKKIKTQQFSSDGAPAKGFSLLELLIVMVISGVVMSVVFGVVSIYFERLRAEKLVHLEKNVYIAMDTFRNRAGRYPCPALRPTAAAPNAFGDGVENCANPVTVGGARAPFTAAADNQVAVGVLPEYGIVGGQRLYLKDLIPKDNPIQSDFIDPWGDRLTYAVTVGLMKAATFDERNGTIALVDENKDPTNGINKNAHYVAISHGSDRAGAVNEEGQIAVPCPAAGTELETPNCNPGDQATRPFVSALIMKSRAQDNVLDASSGANITGNMYFNDYVFSSRYYQSVLWNTKTISSTRADLISAAPGRVGIGVAVPAAALDVGNSVVRVDRAVVLSARNDLTAAHNRTGLLCTSPDNGVTVTCLDPLSLFSLRCPDDADGTFQYMTGTTIQNNQIVPVCDKFRVRLADPTKTVAQCPNNGSLVKGIFSDGSIRCLGAAGRFFPQ